MGRQRRPKRSQPDSSSSIEGDEPYGSDVSSDEEKFLELPMSVSGKKRKSRVGLGDRAPAKDDGNDPPYDPAHFEKNLAFCCAACFCKDKKRKRFSGSAFIGNGSMGWHRRCCHNAKSTAESWTSEFQAACIDPELAERPTLANVVTKSKDELEPFYKTSKRMESQLYNEDFQPDAQTLLHTDEKYNENLLRFQDLLRSKDARSRSCVVLDTFAGIGTGILVLKRLGIRITKVIHCDHDKVATHVYQSNHDQLYNEDLPEDNIKQVYLDSFEDLENGIHSIMNEHGPIDLVLGGPPCGDHSGANAYRKGNQGEQGSYLVRFARLISIIRNHCRQVRCPLFFLVENVPIRNNEDREKIKEALEQDWEPIEMDSKYLSPCNRKRHFFTNVPLLENIDYQGGDSEVTPGCCLEEGYQLPSNWLERDLGSKANTFMASSSRINDERMLVFRKEPGQRQSFSGRPFLVEEREKMMGYPEGYVSEPVDRLFKVILEDGFSKSVEGKDWRKELDTKFHKFQGNCHRISSGKTYEFDTHGFPMLLKIAPPQSGKSVSFLDAKSYMKRLIGNAYSVPVVELLLKPLQKLFSTKNYERYNYRYKWHASLPVQLPRNRTQLRSTLDLTGSSDDSESDDSDETLKMRSRLPEAHRAASKPTRSDLTPKMRSVVDLTGSDDSENNSSGGSE